jgi:polysaccharide pyruvyl transferase CsaB
VTQGSPSARHGRVFACGYYGFGNEGDEVILQGLRAGLEKRCPGLRWVVSSGDPEQTVERHGVEAVSWVDPAAIADAVASSDLVLVGGGGLFQDYWGCDPSTFFTPAHSNITFYGLPILLAALLGKPARLQDVGVGPLETGQGRALVRALAEAATGVSVRDRPSRDLLVSLGLPEESLELTADPSFAVATPAVPADPESCIGVSLRHWEGGSPADAWEPHVAAALDRVLDRSPTRRVLFVPMQAGHRELEDDVAVAERVSARLRHRNRASILDTREIPGGVRAALARCDVVLGMRLHSVLFAMAAGRPVVGLSYDPKVVAALERAGRRESAVQLDDVPRCDLARMLDEARPVDPAHVDTLRRLALASAAKAVDAMKSGKAARMTPSLGAVVLDVWRRQLERPPAGGRDAAHRLEGVRLRWEGLADQLRRIRATLEGHGSVANQGR